MDQQAFIDAVDRAIKNVAEEEFRRLATSMASDMLSTNIHAALNALGGLQHGDPPDYNDPWVALFYLTWYQPGQINLCRRMIDYLGQIKGNGQLIGNDNRNLHVVDFGCGALAMRFAVAWASAEALEGGRKIDSIRVISYDTGTAMVQLGVKVWNQFLLETRRDSRLRSLSHSVEEVIKPRDITLQFSRSSQHIERTSGITYCGQNTDAVASVPLSESVENLVNWLDGYCWMCNTIARREIIEDETERWLTAIHTVYSEYVEDIKRSLERVAKDFDPDVGLMTCHNNYQSISNLNRASPFNTPKYRNSTSITVAHGNNYLPNVTLWRRNLNQNISGHPFLNNDVTWTFPRAFGQFYIKQA